MYNLYDGNGFISGLFVWNGSKWTRTVTEILNTGSSLNMLSFYGDITSASGSSDGSGGTQFDLSGAPISIPEDGPYAFSFRLYGRLNTNVADRHIYYISIWTNLNSSGNITSSSKMLDIAEINLTTLGGNATNVNIRTYSVTLWGTLKANDRVKFKISHYNNGLPWLLLGKQPTDGLKADCTSMIWWRL